MPTLNYYRRIFSAYLLGGKSHLTFWHEIPAENPNASTTELGEYYMLFAEKADYQGAYDPSGIPQLDYHGHIGLQYNPIAIAQYGLGNYNLWRQTGDPTRKQKFLLIADWLCSHLEPNAHGLAVWNHHFNWEYRDTLRAPWYSALAQGQGISLLVRAHKETGDPRYLDAARRAFITFQRPISEGGVAFTDESGDLWFEEYIVSPPTHILNGFIWALWGIYDYFLATKDISAQDLFSRGVLTLLHNLDRLRSRILVALRAVRNAPADGRQYLLSPAAHRAVAHHASPDRGRYFRPHRRPLGKLYPEPFEPCPRPRLQNSFQAPVLLSL